MRTGFILFCLLNICAEKSGAQIIDADLLKIKHRMDSIEKFTASLKLDVDISFINMPTKYAGMTYVKGKPPKYSSDDFVMIPKRGLDFTLDKIFERIRMNAATINVLVASLKITATVRLTTEKNIMDNVPDTKAICKR